MSDAAAQTDQSVTTAPKLEYIPVYAYHLLRRLSQGTGVPTATLFGQDDDAAVAFLVSRGLARIDGDGDAEIIATAAGDAIGLIADER